MKILIISIIEIVIGFIVHGVDYYYNYQISTIFYGWLGFSETPGFWTQFLISGGLYLAGFFLLGLVLRIEFAISKREEDHAFSYVYRFLAKFLGNYYESWPLFYLIPLSILHGALLFVLKGSGIRIEVWYSIALLIIGLWAIHFDKNCTETIVTKSEKAEEEVEVSASESTQAQSDSLISTLIKEPWFHNQTVFRVPWPSSLSTTSSVEYKKIPERFSQVDTKKCSDDFAQMIYQDPVLSGLFKHLVNEKDSEIDAPFFSHQEDVFNKFTERVDKDGNPVHVLITTPIGSGRTLVSIMSAVRCVLKYHENVLFVFKDPAYGRILAEKVKEGLQDSGWDWAISLVEYWSDEEFPRNSVLGRKLEDFQNPDILITDVDTIHKRLLPEHKDWYRFLSGVGLIIAEGLEKYGGIDGANSSQVFLRLRRILDHYQSNPQIIGTATTFDGLETFFERLFKIDSKKFAQDQIVSKDGRERKKKEIIIWNTAVAHHERDAFDQKPPLSQDALDLDIRNLISKTLKMGRRPVLLSKTFKICGSDVHSINDEIVHMYNGANRADVDVIVGEDIEIMSSESGRVRILSPLDVDTVIIAGVPGSWNQLMHELDHLGGRRELDPTIVLLLPHTPLYQYLSRDFYKFINNSSLHAPQLPSGNPYIREEHIKATLAELPGTEEEILQWFGQDGLDALRRLQSRGELVIEESYEIDTNQKGAFVQKYSLAEPTELLRTSIKHVGANVWRLMIDKNVAGWLSEDQIGWNIYPNAVITLDRQRFFIDDIDEKQHIVFARRTEMEKPISTERVLNFDSSSIEFEVERSSEEMDGQLRSVNKTFYEGAPKISFYRPTWVTIQETIIGYTRYKNFSYFNAGGSQIYSPPMKRPAFRTRGFALGFPGANEIVLHTISHLIRSAMPLFLNENSLDMEIITLKECEILSNDPAILIYDTIRGGTGVADWFIEEDNVEKVLRTCLDMLISCPCSDGCRGCVVIHNCNNFDPAESECKFYDKAATLEYLGSIFNRNISEVIANRKGNIKSHPTAEIIRDKIVEYVFPHKLGLEIGEVASLTLTDDLPENIGGLYVGSTNSVLVRSAPEDQLIMVLAHEYAHNWQHKGSVTMHPSLTDPERIPFDGKLFSEGFAQWVEYKVADFYGLHWFKDQIKFQHYNEYLEGFRILNWIEYNFNKEIGLGAGKVIEFITTSKLVVEDIEIDLATMIKKSGVEASLKDAVARFKDNPPPVDIVETLDELDAEEEQEINTET